MPFWQRGAVSKDMTYQWVVKGEAQQQQRLGQAARRAGSPKRRLRANRRGITRHEVAAVPEDPRANVKDAVSAEPCVVSKISELAREEKAYPKEKHTMAAKIVKADQYIFGRCKKEEGCESVAKIGRDHPSNSSKPPRQVTTCPSGHILQSFTTSLPAICGVCTAEPTVGSIVWGCRDCDFDCCFVCHGAGSDRDNRTPPKDKMATANLHDGTSTASTDTPRGDHDITLTHSDDVWWAHEAAWSWDWPEAKQSTDYESDLHADETFIGPDGELYEVFYPSDSMPSTCIEQELPLDPELHCLDGESLEACQNSVHQQTSAEIGISTILAYMRGVAVVRYPAKARLFETVQTATTIALGDHFQRFALVGSTALRIDTPDSDLDAVVFTQSATSASGEEQAPPPAAQILAQVAKTLQACDVSLRLQLVDCTRVPVLTVYTGDESLSLDLTVDQPLSEWHVLWLQSQRKDPFPDASFMREVPAPTLDGWEQGLEAAALRCVKWWLRRRHIPVSKEGGYPTVVWTLMVMHVLRCSVFYNEAGNNRGRPIADERTLLGAIATFFDRFTEGGLAGTLLFAEGRQAEFWPQPLPADSTRPLPVLSGESFSVLDPTTTSQDSAAFGIMPVELAPRISSATQLLHAYELSRGQQLSQQALMCGEDATSSDDGGVALSALFTEANAQLYLLPAYVPPEPIGVMCLCEGVLVFGILHRINLKPGWGATFLNRRDTTSSIAIIICDVDVELQKVTPQLDLSQHWIRPSDVVCMASIYSNDEGVQWDYQDTPTFNIDIESLERWCKMQALLHVETHSTVCEAEVPRKPQRSKKSERNRRHGKGARI